MALKRGDIVFCVVSGDFGKPRPALVIQSNLFNGTHASVVLLPITSHKIDAPLFRITVMPGKTNGLGKRSQIMVDKMTAVHGDRIRDKIGHLSPALLKKIDEALALWLALD